MMWTPTGNIFQTQIDIQIEQIQSHVITLERDKITLELQLMQVEVELSRLLINMDFIKREAPVAVSMREYALIKSDIRNNTEIRSKIIKSLSEIDKLIDKKEDEIRKLFVQRGAAETKIILFTKGDKDESKSG